VLQVDDSISYDGRIMEDGLCDRGRLKSVKVPIRARMFHSSTILAVLLTRFPCPRTFFFGGGGRCSISPVGNTFSKT